MITSINHVSFTVADLDRSVHFYRDVLGLDLLDIGSRPQEFSELVTGIPGAQLRIAYLAAPNCAVELVQYLSPPGDKLDTRTCNVGSAHVCFFVDDFKAFIMKLRCEGVTFPGTPSVVPAGPNRGRGVAYFEDPDANTLELISNAPLHDQQI